MDRNEAKLLVKNAELIKAFAEGKEIQYRAAVRCPGGYRQPLPDRQKAWRNLDYPTFKGMGEYRIKPEPHRGWMIVNNKDVRVVYVDREAETEWMISYYDRYSRSAAPHRAIPLIEEITE